MSKINHIAWDDTVLPFQLDRSDIRGRVARLDGVLDHILSRHDYPAPVGALADVVEGEDGDELYLRAVVLAGDGSVEIRRSAVGDPADAAGVGRRLADEMLADGAAVLMQDDVSPEDGEQDA